MKLAALSVAGVAWGLINFGLLLWLPNHFVSKGYSMAVASRLLAESALIAFPTIFAGALLHIGTLVLGPANGGAPRVIGVWRP